MSKPVIREATLEDLKGYHACLSRVALERKYIGFLEAPPVEKSKQWMESVLRSGCPFLVVESLGEIVGWCDVGRNDRQGFTHLGELGMGLDSNFRGQGLGAELLRTAVGHARRVGLEKLELEVFASNVAARKLYEKLGFSVDGVRVKARKLGEEYTDVVCMSLFLADSHH